MNQSNSVKVSVIIPTHNRGRYIAEAIDSVLAQTYRDFEIIVVDDGSTDDTTERLEAYGERIRYIAQDNAGPGVARNRGILESRGKYVAFLDSDDVWYPTKLEKQVAILDSQPTVGLVYSHCTRGPTMDATAEAHFSKLAPRSGKVFEQLTQANYIKTPTVLIRRAVFALAGIFDPTLQVSEDYDLWVRIAHFSTCVYLDESLAHVREHAGRISYDLSRAEARCRSRELQACRWGFLPQMESVFREAATKAYADCAWAYRTRGQYAIASAMYRKAARCSRASCRLRIMAFLTKWASCVFRLYDRSVANEQDGCT